MDWNVVKGNWKQLKGKLKQTWDELTDDDLNEIAGKQDQLISKIQSIYGITQEEAASEVDDFIYDFMNEDYFPDEDNDDYGHYDEDHRGNRYDHSRNRNDSDEDDDYRY